MPKKQENWTGVDRAAAEALRFAQQTRPVNTRETARIIDEGVQPLQNGEIDQSFRSKPQRAVQSVGATDERGMPIMDAADIMARTERKQYEQTANVMEKIAALLEDGDINPFTGQKAGITREKHAEMKRSRFLDSGNDESDQEDPFRNDSKRRPVMEDDEDGDDDGFLKPMKSQNESWTVVDSMARSKSTKIEMPVWKVQNEEKGAEIQHMFRIEEAAIMACEYMNSGKKEQAKAMIEMDKHRIVLSQKARQLKESNNRDGYRTVMKEIAQINAKLGL